MAIGNPCPPAGLGQRRLPEPGAFAGTYLAASLFAATSPDAKPAGYSGSSQKFGFKGPVKEAKPAKEAVSEQAAKQLFDKLA